MLSADITLTIFWMNLVDKFANYNLRIYYFEITALQLKILLLEFVMHKETLLTGFVALTKNTTRAPALEVKKIMNKIYVKIPRTFISHFKLV
jgi:hypothetical protein